MDLFLKPKKEGEVTSDGKVPKPDVASIC